MEPDRRIRSLVAEQLGVELGDVDELALVDLALALEDALGVVVPRPRLMRLGSYGDLLRLLRDALVADADHRGEEIAACFVRARIVAGGADGRVTLVRVGWLTPDLAAAIADDVRNAAEGTWLDVVVPDDLSETALTALRQRLRWLVGSHLRLNVRRAAEAAGQAVGPIATGARDQMSQRGLGPESDEAAGQTMATGTGLAESPLHPCCSHRRRSRG
jgi:acyl carrier protein